MDTREKVSRFSRKAVRPSGWRLEAYQPSQLPECAEQRENKAARVSVAPGHLFRGLACYRRALFGGEGGRFLGLAEPGVSGARVGQGRPVGKAWLGPQGPAGPQAALGGITAGGRRPPGGHWGTGKRGRGLGGRQLILRPPLPRAVPRRCSHLPFPSRQHGPGKSTGQSEAHQGLSRGPGLELSLPRVSGCPQR